MRSRPFILLNNSLEETSLAIDELSLVSLGKMINDGL
jgi:hypothetical protein